METATTATGINTEIVKVPVSESFTETGTSAGTSDSLDATTVQTTSSVTPDTAPASLSRKRKASEIDDEDSKIKRAVFRELHDLWDQEAIKERLATIVTEHGVDWLNTGDDAFDDRGILHEAVMHHNQELIKALLKTDGINVNRLDAHGWTPFVLACHSGDMDVVKLLINDPRVDINALNRDPRVDYSNLDKSKGTTGIEHIIGYWGIFEISFIKNIVDAGREIIWSDEVLKKDAFAEERKAYQEFVDQKNKEKSATQVPKKITKAPLVPITKEEYDIRMNKSSEQEPSEQQSRDTDDERVEWIPKFIKDTVARPDYNELMAAHFKQQKLEELADMGWTGKELPQKDEKGRYPQLSCIECGKFFDVDYDKLGLTDEDIDDEPTGYYTNVYEAKNRIICNPCIEREAEENAEENDDDAGNKIAPVEVTVASE